MCTLFGKPTATIVSETAPLVAWKVFRLAGKRARHVDHRTGMHLTGEYGLTPFTFAEMYAYFDVGPHTCRSVYGRDRYADVVPHLGGRSGFYAFRTRKEAERNRLQSRTRPRAVVRKVRLWGRVVEYENWWRAQYMKISDPKLRRKPRSAGQIDRGRKWAA